MSLAILETPDQEPDGYHVGRSAEGSAAVASIIAAGRVAAVRGWVPATSGNFSVRQPERRIAITASGVDKGDLQLRDVLDISLDAPPPPGSSAETGLHLALYRRYQEIGAVVHVHAPNATVLSRRQARSQAVVLDGYELLKAFAGTRTHETALSVPIFANSQDIAALADEVDARLGAAPPAPGYLLAGHGLYAWGATMRDALRHTEAFEFLFGCEIVGGTS
jgi:methylthioribulose-1-phosphate dehydratase